MVGEQVVGVAVTPLFFETITPTLPVTMTRGGSTDGHPQEGGIVLSELSPRLDHRHARTVRDYIQGTSHRWAACLGASRIVGSGRPGATAALANDLAISVSQVENLARAGLGYRWLRRVGGERVQALRRRLTPSHFCVAADGMIRYDIQPGDVINALETAASEGASVAALADYLRGEYGNDDNKDVWIGHYRGAVKSLKRLAYDYGVPPAVQLIAQRAVNELVKLGY